MKARYICISIALMVVGLALNDTSKSYAESGSFEKAVKLYDQQRYQAALLLFCQLTEKQRTNPTPIYYAALCYQQTGDNDRANQYYQYLVKNFPKSKEAELAGSALKTLDAACQQRQSARLAVATGRTDSGLSPQALAASTSFSLMTTKDLPKDPDTASRMLKHQALSEEEWTRLPEETKVPFRRGTSNHLFLDGYVNGRRMSLMFDTGAENCHFGKADLAAAGIPFEPGGPKIPVGGVAGTTTCAIMMADISVGGIKRHLPILVAEESVGFAIVGETFFGDFRYEIDNSQGFIRFIKKSRPGTTSHVFESADLIKIPFQARGNNMVVKVKVNGNEIPMYFDTGASSITLNMMHAQALGINIPPDAQQVVCSGAGGMVRGFMFNVERIELGPILKTNIPIIVNQSMTPDLPLLGQPFYKDRRVTIDNENQVIEFVH